MKTITEIKQVKEKEILVDNMIKSPGLYCLLAKAKVGKSLLALQLADALSNNKQFLENNVIPYPVLYVSTEVSSNQLVDRINKMNITFNDKNFFFVERELNSSNINLMDLEIDIQDFARNKNGKLIILDMLYGINLGVAYDINSYQDMGQKALPKLRSLCDKYDLTILFVHHLNKQGLSLGSTAIDTSVDGKFVLIQDNIIKDKFTLYIESRDFESKEISLTRNKNLVFELNKEDYRDDLDYNLIILLNHSIINKEYKTTSAELTAKLQLKITPTKFTRLIKNNIVNLQKQGLHIEFYRTSLERGFFVKYIEPDYEN